MDPYGEVVREGCEGLAEIATNGTELLFHFTAMLGRATFRALTHQHSKVRVAGLKALN